MHEPLTTATTYSPFIESNPRAGAERLRAAMNEHGYRFFRALVPADEADAEWHAT